MDRAPLARDLTASEAIVAQKVAEGKSNRVIAGELKITESTVKKHVSATLLKLGLGSRVQIALWAIKCSKCGRREFVVELPGDKS